MQFDAFDAVKTCTGVYLSVLSGECKGLEAFIYGALCVQVGISVEGNGARGRG